MSKNGGPTTTTLAMALCAAGVAEMAIAPTRTDFKRSIAALAIAGVVAGGLAVRRRETAAAISSWETVAVVAAGVAPFVLEPAWRALAGTGSPYEALLAETLRNLMLALLGLRTNPSAKPLVVAASLFLVLYGSMWSNGPASIILLVAYGLLGALWLLTNHWRRVGPRLTASSSEQTPKAALFSVLIGISLLAIPVAPLASRSDMPFASLTCGRGGFRRPLKRRAFTSISCTMQDFSIAKPTAASPTQENAFPN